MPWAPTSGPGGEGYRYGTILVNLADHRVVDLLPDRSAAVAPRFQASTPG